MYYHHDLSFFCNPRGHTTNISICRCTCSCPRSPVRSVSTTGFSQSRSTFRGHEEPVVAHDADCPRHHARSQCKYQRVVHQFPQLCLHLPHRDLPHDFPKVECTVCSNALSSGKMSYSLYMSTYSATMNAAHTDRHIIAKRRCHAIAGGIFLQAARSPLTLCTMRRMYLAPWIMRMA